MIKRFLALSVLFTLGVSAQVVYFNYSKNGFFATGSWESPGPNVKPPYEVGCMPVVRKR